MENLVLRAADLGSRSRLNGIISQSAGSELLVRGDGSFAIFCKYPINRSHLVLSQNCTIAYRVEKIFVPIRLQLTTHLGALICHFVLHIADH